MRVVAVLSVAGVVQATDINPVQQVIKLLDEMRTKVSDEGAAEAKTYNKFACFCKDETKAKTNSINSGAENVGRLTADLESLNTDQDNLQQKLNKTRESIASEQRTKKKDTEEYEEYKQQYKVELVDTTKAITLLRNALESLKNSRPSFVEFKSVMAKVSGLARSVSSAPAVPTADYEFHSNKIVETLRGLEADFVQSKDELEKTHIEKTGVYDRYQQELHDEIQALKKVEKNTVVELSQTNESIAAKQGELTLVQSNLNDDQVYLKDLTEKCRHTKVIWDQRTSARTEELHTLTEAIAIIQGTVSDRDEKTAHESDKQRADAKIAAADRSRSKDVEERRQRRKAEKKAEGFVQVALHKNRAFMGSRSPMERAADVLMNASKKLGNNELSTLATRVTEDPLGRVKQMIQNLIEKLMDEANNDGNHKGWCDSQLTDVKQRRDQKLEVVQLLSSEIESNEANRERLGDELEKLADEIKEAQDALQKATELRAAQKKENQESIENAEEGRKAVVKATEVLNNFYKKAAKFETPALVQQPEAPDAGFDSAYQGDQDTSVGIFGMLEVITSDFERSIKESSEEEVQQNNDFVQEARELNSLIESKTTTKEQLDQEFATTTEDISAGLDKLKDTQAELDTAVREWMALKPACVDHGVSYEERKGKRKDEIRALKSALCILEDREDC